MLNFDCCAEIYPSNNYIKINMAKRRPTILFYESYPYFSGAQRVLYFLLKKMSRRTRYRCIMLCSTESRLAAAIRDLGIHTYILYPGDNLDKYNKEILNVHSIAKAAFPYIQHTIRLVCLINKEKPDIIHANSIRALFLIFLAAKITKSPLVWHLRGCEKSRYLHDIAFNITSKIIGVSYGVKSVFRTSKQRSGKMSIVYDGIDAENFSLGASESKTNIRKEFQIGFDCPIIGVIALLTYAKGQEYFLRAAKTVVSYFPDVRFLIVGDATTEIDKKFEKHLREMTRVLSLERNVIFTGWRDDVPAIMNMLDIVVLPSLYEGLPRTILEAMAMSKPIIATTVGGIPELVVNGETGILVPPKDSESLANVMIKLLSNPSEAWQMGKAGYVRVKQYFTVEKMVEDTEKIFDELLTKKRSM